MPGLARPCHAKVAGIAGHHESSVLQCGVCRQADLTRLNLRKNHLELAMGDPAVAANFVEMRRVTSELADIEVALVTAEDAWLEIEERAP